MFGARFYAGQAKNLCIAVATQQVLPFTGFGLANERLSGFPVGRELARPSRLLATVSDDWRPFPGRETSSFCMDWIRRDGQISAAMG